MLRLGIPDALLEFQLQFAAIYIYNDTSKNYKYSCAKSFNLRECPDIRVTCSTTATMVGDEHDEQ